MKRIVLSMLLIVSLLLCACHAESDISLDGSSSALQTENSEQVTSVGVTADSEQSEPTESELFELHAQRVLAMLEECRPEEAYQFPDFSGEITDVRITVRDRKLDMYLWSGNAEEKGYDVFYGYLSNGVWHDFPSGNYELKDLVCAKDREELSTVLKYDDSWESCTQTHVVEIGPYIICAFPIGSGYVSSSLPNVSVTDTLSSPVQAFTEYYNLQKNGSSKEPPANWHYKENMYAYGTDNFDFYMEPFAQWYFIVLEKEQLTEEYSIIVTQDWEKDYYDVQNTCTYEDIMFALNRQ